MQIETSLHGSSSRRRRVRALAALTMSVVAGAAMTGCGGTDQPSGVNASSSSPGQQDSDERVLWLGDSIAAVQAPPLRAALKASGADFKDASSDGGGTVVEGDKDDVNSKIAKSTWKDLDKSVASFQPNVIVYQITTYDWGTAQQQRASYDKLARTARDAGAELVIVSAPPFKLDDFYKPYESAIKSAPKAAEKVADASGDTVRFFDSAQLWGTDSGAKKAQRSADGIHSCQQGSASFAKWLTGKLGQHYGFAPAAPRQWANGSWAEDDLFASLDCG